METKARYVLARSYGGHTTNLPLPDLRDGQAWIAYEYEGAALHPEHGGPARLLVPHLYFWKSANWRVATLAAARDETATARTLVFDVPGWPGHLAGSTWTSS